jgi:hypothetical protein
MQPTDLCLHMIYAQSLRFLYTQNLKSVVSIFLPLVARY